MHLQKCLKYIGLPFKIGGRGKEYFDCYGLVRLFYENEFNIKLPLYDLYDNFDRDLLYNLIDENLPLLDFNKTENPVYGDLGLFKFKGQPTHLTIYIEKNKILHTMLGVNSIIESLDSPRLKGRFIGWYTKKH